LLLGELSPDAGEVRHGARLQIAYFDQQREQLDPDVTVADSVNDGNSTVVANGQPRHIIGYLADFLFPRERAVSPVKALSGGERNRLLLARLFARPANVLVLDEPTNDLDIETLELLEELIADFDGTVLLVSHDRVFLDRIVTSTIAFEGQGRVVEYVGGWHDYLRQKASTANAQLPTPKSQLPTPKNQLPTAKGQFPTSNSQGPRGNSQELTSRADVKRKLSYKEQRELESLPARIEGLEAEQERLRKASESSEFYKEDAGHIKGVLDRLQAIGPELEEAIARWMELEERSL
jgi:ATP-binding cassette subfamily F protein uup